MTPFSPAARALLLVALVARAGAGTAFAASPEATGWQLEIRQEAGAPDGWVQVRENASAGTRLDFGRDLHLGHSAGTLVELAWQRRPESRWVLDLSGTSLSGDATAAAGTMFNGTSVVAGSRLATRTGYSDFLALRLAWERTLAVGDRVTLFGTAAAEFTALDFRLRGTVAADSPGHELDEDFVTQELPAPLLGLGLRATLTPRLRLRSSFAAGGLPKMYSFRNEGGRVDVAQRQGEVALALDWSLGRDSALELGARRTWFDQEEQSGEDGNRVVLRDTRVGLGWVWHPARTAADG